MYFAAAIFYALSTIGLVSIMLVIAATVQAFNVALIRAELGYRNYCLLVGGYWLGAMPLAATLNGGTGRDFLLHLGWEAVILIALGQVLERRYKTTARARRHAAHIQAAAAASSAPPPLPFPSHSSGFTAAPSSLAGDFDVPPQR